MSILNKSDFIKRLRAKGWKKYEAEKLLEDVWDVTIDCLLEDNVLFLSGICKFTKVTVPAHFKKTPQGLTKAIPKREKIMFKMSDNLLKYLQ
ncbi:hypothetical protein D7X33_14815 [Butyricicoccus sp. 1XD8-22]|nr:hypothetical protein D7X33_14815 [Butyricicoccus sp. 1XD8-22]